MLMGTTLADRAITWYDVHARDLPWRQAATTPWGVMVSEVMLQQTPVARVEPVWTAWMHRWPEPAALAAEPAGEAIRAWGRLGYPRRALRLHGAASLIVERHHGVVPSDVDELNALPGIGTYTARAVAVFGFGLRHPVVDTNVRRLIARTVLGSSDGEHLAVRDQLSQVEAQLPRPPRRAARASIAFMELGALVCTARNPDCGHCPLRRLCTWHTSGRAMPTGPTRRAQTYAGTDRQVRGRLLAVLRDAAGPVGKSELDAVWPLDEQRERALASLVADGLVIRESARYVLPG
jgi:A/G-specific adenine glycosylase